MSEKMEPLVMDENIEIPDESAKATPLDSTTEWIDVIERRREAEKKQLEEDRKQAAMNREAELKRKAIAAEEEAKKYAQLLAAKAKRRHRNKIIFCLLGIVLMLILSGGSFVLQYFGYLQFPLSIVITGVFCVVAAFFCGVVWECCRNNI